MGSALKDKQTMERHFDQDLNELKEKLLTMASHAEAAVNRAIQALANRDLELALRVKNDDNVLDRFEVEIDDLAIHLLSKAPLASDLRANSVAGRRCMPWGFGTTTSASAVSLRTCLP